MEFQTSVQDCLSKTTSKTEILYQDSTDPVQFHSTYIFTFKNLISIGFNINSSVGKLVLILTNSRLANLV